MLSLQLVTSSIFTLAASPTTQALPIECRFFHLSIQVLDTDSVPLNEARLLAFSSRRPPSTGVLVLLICLNQIHKALSTSSFLVALSLLPVVLPWFTEALILSLAFSQVATVLLGVLFLAATYEGFIPALI